MKCIGYKETEGKCKKSITNPEHGKYWCDECNKIRLETITKQFETIKNSFPQGGKDENLS